MLQELSGGGGLMLLEILGPLWIRGNCYTAWYTLSPMILKFRSSPILHMRKLENRWGTANCQGPQWSNIIDRWTDRQGGFKLALPTPKATFHLPNHAAPCQDNKLTSNWTVEWLAGKKDYSLHKRSLSNIKCCVRSHIKGHPCQIPSFSRWIRKEITELTGPAKVARLVGTALLMSQKMSSCMALCS